MLEAKFKCFSTNCKIKSNAPKSLIDEAILECARLERKWNFYDPLSELSALNKRHLSDCGEYSLKLTSSEARALKVVQILSHKSAFNPAVGALKFSREVDLLKAHFYVENELLITDEVCDFGGVFKEAAVDICAMILDGYFYVINFGGDLRSSNELNVWIKNPFKPNEPIASIQLANGGALCSSANYERAGHIIGAECFKSASVCLSTVQNPAKLKDAFNLSNPQNLKDAFLARDGAGEISSLYKDIKKQNPANLKDAFNFKNPQDLKDAFNLQNPQNLKDAFLARDAGTLQDVYTAFSTLSCGIFATLKILQNPPLPAHFGALLVDKRANLLSEGEIDFKAFSDL